MPSDLREYAEFFKDRVDELCLLEKKIEEQAEELKDVSQNCIAANEAHMNRAMLRLESVSGSFEHINNAASKVEEYIHFCSTHVKLTLFLFFGSLIMAFCVSVGTYFWYKHVAGEVAEANLELAQANAKLNHKPLFLPAGSSVAGSENDYVRVVPNTETTMSHANGEDYPGVYAQVWAK